MKRCFTVLLSVLLLAVAVLPVSAAGDYNDDQFNWGEYACPHTVVKEVAAVESTCTIPGHGAYKRCVDCAIVTEGSDEALPLADHVYDDVIDTDCNVCGAVYIPGDVNSDGKVNNQDLALLQMFCAGWTISWNKAAADINDDGTVNNQDLALLQKYCAGWDITLK